MNLKAIIPLLNPQDIIIITSLSEEEDDLLWLLALRAASNCTWWYYHSSTSNYKLLTCLICNEVMDGGEAMVKHAREHLKESNLLPFI